MFSILWSFHFLYLTVLQNRVSLLSHTEQWWWSKARFSWTLANQYRAVVLVYLQFSFNGRTVPFVVCETVQQTVISETPSQSMPDKGTRWLWCQCGGQFKPIHSKVPRNSALTTDEVCRYLGQLCIDSFRCFGWNANDGSCDAFMSYYGPTFCWHNVSIFAFKNDVYSILG